MNKQLIIFDMDGTILDTLKDLGNSLNYALTLSHFPEKTLSQVKSYVGNGIQKLIERALPAGSNEAEVKQVYQDFMTHYELHCSDFTRPYEGIPELIRTLRRRGYKTAVVSNKADPAVQELCLRFFPGLFDLAVGERLGYARKPEPDLVSLVLSELQISPANALYIGDSEVDIATARNAGIDSLIVDWGFRDAHYLQSRGACCIVSSCREILEKLP